MKIHAYGPGDAGWEALAAFADSCSWAAGKGMAAWMRSGNALPWERAFAALEQGCIAGYCTLAARDCVPELPYTPFIGYVFVAEAFRGRRLSQRLVHAALAQAGRLGYTAAYLISDHAGLYEKYGFVPVDSVPAPWNPEKTETVFRYHLPPTHNEAW